MSLARMRDLAGFRLVGMIDSAAQDRLFQEITKRFPADPRPPRRVDRRAQPSHGYRALHAEVSFDGVSMEIQIRTVFQHVWADLIERIADRLGRQIRYGEPPVPPPCMTQQQADAIVANMMELSEAFAFQESRLKGRWTAQVDLVAVTEGAWSTLRAALRNTGVEM
ncbi:MAG: hypothetical protein LBV34_13430 [Nocardiopsaceae bacterium]|jgi:ppGpp synthetase/RelA/SpoT-type nucleotidyltranferase|nr:hypothetical protein [Nocardiopsaceae bacterium]